jgi:multidrug efflux pump subunit AcrB
VLETRTQKPLKNKALKSLDGGVQKILDRLDAAYGKALAAVMKHRLATVVLVVAAFVGSIAALPNMHVVFSPPMNEDSVTLTVELPLGTKYEETKAVMLQLQEMTLGASSEPRTSSSTSAAPAASAHPHPPPTRTDHGEARYGQLRGRRSEESRRSSGPSSRISRTGLRVQPGQGPADRRRIGDRHRGPADVLETGLSAAKEIVSIIEERCPK